MDFKVLIADAAVEDLREIIEFVAKDSPEAAIKLGEKLVARALNLRTMPQRFPFHDEHRGIRKMPLQPYPVFYTYDQMSNTVNILHIWHGARRLPEFTD